MARYTLPMVQSAAKTHDAYLAELPESRREVIAAMHKLIRKHLPKGYDEQMNWGMLTWVIPLDQYPDTYNGMPLAIVGLCAQKNYNALYILGPYTDPEQSQAKKLREAFKAAGKKLDMGKSCVRFQKMEDLALDAIADVIASTPPKRYLEMYEAGRAHAKPKSPSKKKRA